MRRVGIVIAGMCATGCLATPPPEPVYAVQRSALIPHPAPPAWSGTPPRGRVQFRASSSTVVVPAEPEESEGANAGLFVARHNLSGTIRMRVGDNWDLSVMAAGSPNSDAMRISDASLGVPDGASWTKGAGIHWSAPLGGPLRLGLGAEIRHSTSPYRELGVCVQNCELASAMYTEEGSHALLGHTLMVVPSYDLGDVVVFASLSNQNHPTNTRKQLQTAASNNFDDNHELREGPGYTMLGAGIELRMWQHLTVIAHVFQPLSTDVATYGPAVGFAIGGELYDPQRPRYSKRQLAGSLQRR